MTKREGIMFELGYLIKPEHRSRFNRYFQEMIERDRVLIIQSNGRTIGIIFYFLGNSVEQFDNKPTWLCPQDNPEGHILFIDKMVCKKFNVALKNSLYEAFVSQYPNVTECHWLREPNNRRVIIRKKETHVYA